MRLSVIVTIVDGGAALDRCLASLASQTEAPDLDIIVPWDDTVPDIDQMERRYRQARFLPLGHLETVRPRLHPAGQHELFDRRRAAGVGAATGDIVAILEDRGVPRPDWAGTMVRLHAVLPNAVIGGAIENGRDRLLNWAVYFCDFGRYQRPLAAGPAAWVSDVNVSYKRRAIDQTREVWCDEYHEPDVHGSLREAGETLFLSPEPVVDEIRDDLRLGPLLGERFAWGRLFARTRARRKTVVARAGLAILTPVLPFVLLGRHLKLQLDKQAPLSRVLTTLPAVITLLVCWSAGEALGYVTARR